MNHLRCTARECVNNQNDFCTRDTIEISGPCAGCASDTCCASFAKREETYSNVVGLHVKANAETDVRCSASTCSHYQHGHCSAENIDVGGVSAGCCGETQCATFDPRNGI